MLITYFSIGLIYLLLHCFFAGFKYSLKRYFVLIFGFVLMWPFLLFNSIKLHFKIGKNLTAKGKLRLYLPVKESKKEKSNIQFDNSDLPDISGYDIRNNDGSNPFE